MQESLTTRLNDVFSKAGNPEILDQQALSVLQNPNLTKADFLQSLTDLENNFLLSCINDSPSLKCFREALLNFGLVQHAAKFSAQEYLDHASHKIFRLTNPDHKREYIFEILNAISSTNYSQEQKQNIVLALFDNIEPIVHHRSNTRRGKINFEILAHLYVFANSLELPKQPIQIQDKPSTLIGYAQKYENDTFGIAAKFCCTSLMTTIAQARSRHLTLSNAPNYDQLMLELFTLTSEQEPRNLWLEPASWMDLNTFESFLRIGEALGAVDQMFEELNGVSPFSISLLMLANHNITDVMIRAIEIAKSSDKGRKALINIMPELVAKSLAPDLQTISTSVVKSTYFTSQIHYNFCTLTALAVIEGRAAALWTHSSADLKKSRLRKTYLSHALPENESNEATVARCFLVDFGVYALIYFACMKREELVVATINKCNELGVDLAILFKNEFNPQIQHNALQIAIENNSIDALLLLIKHFPTELLKKVLDSHPNAPKSTLITELLIANNLVTPQATESGVIEEVKRQLSLENFASISNFLEARKLFSIDYRTPGHMQFYLAAKSPFINSWSCAGVHHLPQEVCGIIYNFLSGSSVFPSKASEAFLALRLIRSASTDGFDHELATGRSKKNAAKIVQKLAESRTQRLEDLRERAHQCQNL